MSASVQGRSASVRSNLTLVILKFPIYILSYARCLDISPLLLNLTRRSRISYGRTRAEGLGGASLGNEGLLSPCSRDPNRGVATPSLARESTGVNFPQLRSTEHRRHIKRARMGTPTFSRTSLGRNLSAGLVLRNE